MPAPAETPEALTNAPRDPAELIEHIKTIVATDRLLDTDFYSDQALQRAFGGAVASRQFVSATHVMIKVNHMGTLFERSSKAWADGVEADFDLDPEDRSKIVKAHFVIGSIIDSRLTVSEVLRDFGASYVPVPRPVGPDFPLQGTGISYHILNGAVRNTLGFSILPDGKVLSIFLVQEKAD